MSSRVFIETWGCQMNDLDTGKMRARLEAEGYLWADSPKQADVVLLNTCSVREKPTHKVRSFLGRLAPLKKAKPHLVVGVTGCYAQQEKARLLRQYPIVDLVAGPDGILRIPELLRRAKEERQVLDTRFDPQLDPRFGDELVLRPGGVSAYVTIQKGCDHVCSFCVVPKTRGRQASRMADDVVAECRGLVGRGVREIILLGQNVNAYGVDRGGVPFHRLLRRIAEEVDLDRIRFTTSNPWDLSDELAQTFAEVEQLAPAFHLPVQSGSDAMLERMKRGHDIAHYLERVDLLRRVRPDLAVSTDIICGHPGEREEDHQATLSLLDEVGFASVFAFGYSPRPRTASERMPDDVPIDAKKRRLQEVLERQAPHTLRFMEQWVGSSLPVLVEGPSKRGTERMGRTPHGVIVNLSGDSQLDGRIVNVAIHAASPNSLRGVLQEAGPLPVLGAS